MITLNRIFRNFAGIASQGIYAGSGFLITLFLAHTLTVERFGSFSLLYAILFLLQTPVIALVGEPTLVFAITRHKHQLGAYFRRTVQLALALSIPMAIMLLMIIPVLPMVSIVGSALALPAVCLYTVVRISCFARGDQVRALKADIILTVSAMVALIIMASSHYLDVTTAFLIIGIANLTAAGSVILGDQKFSRSTSLPIQDVIAENWQYGHWLVCYHILRWGLGLGAIPLAGFLVGLDAAAGLRTVQTLFQPFIQFSISLVLLLVPVVSRRFINGNEHDFRRFMRIVFVGFVGSAAIYSIMLILLANPMMSLLFPLSYRPYVFLFPYLGGSVMLQSLLSAASVYCRVRQRTGVLLMAEASGGVTALVGGYGLAHFWGLEGLAASLVLAPFIGLVVMVARLRVSVLRQT